MELKRFIVSVKVSNTFNRVESLTIVDMKLITKPHIQNCALLVQE